MASEHLIGAYGVFWLRDAVDWCPQGGPQAWQMLGYVGTNNPGLRFCDFRRAKGFYLLFDDYGATYVGLARGSGGLGARLKQHHQDESKRWSRFCWFAFDDVRDVKALGGWSETVPRDAVRKAGHETLIRECEALLIVALGAQNQNQMRFQQAQRWRQVGEGDMARGGRGRKVASGGFTDRWLSSLRLADI